MLKKASIIISVFNEENNIFPLIAESCRAVGSYFDRYEIIVVDDGSTDNTHKMLKKAKSEYACVKILRHNKNYGQSISIISGVKAAKYPLIVTMDGDGQNCPKDIVKLYKTMLEKNLYEKNFIISGVRTKRKTSDGLIRAYVSRFANKLKNSVFKDDCIDAGCGLKLFPKKFFLELPHFNHIHQFITVFFKHHNGIVINVPINVRKRKYGQSKYTLWWLFKKNLMDLIGVKWLLSRTVYPVLK